MAGKGKGKENCSSLVPVCRCCGCSWRRPLSAYIFIHDISRAPEIYLFIIYIMYVCTHTQAHAQRHTQAHSHFYILKRIFLDTLKIGISEQHWRQAIFYRPRKWRGWRENEETVPAETHGQNQNGNRREAPQLTWFISSLRVFCSFSQLSCVFIICQTSISSSCPSPSLPHSATLVVGLGASTRVSHVRVYINLCA